MLVGLAVETAEAGLGAVEEGGETIGRGGLREVRS